jgi:hypothetical protein
MCCRPAYPPASKVVAGSLATTPPLSATPPLRCTLAPDPAIVPATPEVMICVVLTGSRRTRGSVQRRPDQLRRGARADDRGRLPIGSPR